MSDLVITNGAGERKRTWASLATAFAIHAAIITLLAFAVDWGTQSTRAQPIVIDVQLSTPPMPEIVAPAPVARDTPAAAAAVRPAAAPAAAPQAASTQAPETSGGSDFVIPTPRAGQADAWVGAPGPAFQEAGGRTGVAAALPSVQGQAPAPVVAPAQAGKGAGAGSAVGQGTASPTQRSGTAVAVSGAPSASGLDLSQVDKALAGRTAARPGSAAAGNPGSENEGGGQPGVKGGSGADTSGNGTPGTPVNVVWDKPAANVGRTLVSTPAPKLPPWVGAQGLTLSVTVAFTLQPDGVMAAVTLEKSSGYADVDSALIDAIRRWRFNAAKVTTSVGGKIPYIIKTR
jgi:TonB family protein